MEIAIWASGSSLGILEAIGLGLLQGLTEFLPISSSGHLALLQYLLHLEDVPRFFDVMLHVGTLAAVLAYYRRSLWGAAVDAVRGPSADSSADPADARTVRLPPWRTVAFLILATLPTVAAALVCRPTKLAAGQRLEDMPRTWRNRIGDLREYSSSRPWVVLGFLVCTGGVLLGGAQARGGAVDAQSMRWTHVLGIGVAQACSALFPGMSRSGLTISTALVLGLRGEWAVHFSLLMSIPAILGAAVLKTADLDPAWLTPQHLAATISGTIVSAVVGWCCIWMLLGAVRRGRWWWFSVYVWTAAAVFASFLVGRAS